MSSSASDGDSIVFSVSGEEASYNFRQSSTTIITPVVPAIPPITIDEAAPIVKIDTTEITASSASFNYIPTLTITDAKSGVASVTLGGTPIPASGDNYTLRVTNGAEDLVVIDNVGNRKTISVTITPATATINDVDVSGYTNLAITAKTATITLTGEKFNAIPADTNVDSWFAATNLPAGLHADIKTAVDADATQATVTFSGTTAVERSASMVITIPASALVGDTVTGKGDITVTTNANAKWSIAASAGPTCTVRPTPYDPAEPAAVLVDDGDTVTLTATITGVPAPTIKWQKNTSAMFNWQDIPGADSSTYSFTADLDGDNQHTYMYRCVVNNGVGGSSVTTPPHNVESYPPITLYISRAPVIGTQPVASQTVDEGADPAEISVALSEEGFPPPVYQWYVQRGGTGEFVAVTSSDGTGGDSSRFMPARATAAMHGNVYRCEIHPTGRTDLLTTSHSSVLYVNHAPTITTDLPATKEISLTEQAVLEVVVADGHPTPNVFEWMVDKGSGFVVATTTEGTAVTSNEGKTSTFTSVATTTTTTMQGWKFKCVVKNTPATGTALESSSAECTLSVKIPPEFDTITTNPATPTVNPAGTVTITATLKTDPAPTDPVNYRWQVRTTEAGADWTDIPNATNRSYTTPNAIPSMNGYKYRCVANNGVGGDASTNDVYSAEVTLTVHYAPTVTTGVPADVTDNTLGTPATFTITLANEGNPPSAVYQWMYSDDGGYRWNNVSGGVGATSPSYTTENTTAAMNGRKYRCTVSNNSATPVSAFSRAAILTVKIPPEFDGASPVAASVPKGNKATFTASLKTGNVPSTPITYTWWVDRNTGTFVPATAADGTATNNVFETAATTLGMNGYKYKCVANNGYGYDPTHDTESLTATLTVLDTPDITLQPVSATVLTGTSHNFVVNATTTAGTLSYQWKVSTDGGTTWNDSTDIGNDTNTLTVTAAYPYTAAQPHKYLCAVTNPQGTKESESATLTVHKVVEITGQPVAQEVNAGVDVTFSVTANGNPAPNANSYKWQWNTVSDPGSTSWADISGATAESYTFTAQSGDNGKYYRCVATNTTVTANPPATQVNTATSSAVKLTVNYAPVITTDPVSQTVNENTSDVTFTVAATPGFPAAMTYVWEQQANGSTSWSAATGATDSATYTIPKASVTSAINLYKYRCTVKNTAIPTLLDVSTEAALTVHSVPTIDNQPADQTAIAGQTANFTVTASGGYPEPIKYQWQYSTDGGANWSNVSGGTGANTNSYTTPATTAGATGMNNWKYKCIVSNNSSTPAPLKVDTNEVTLTVNYPPTITAHPANQTKTAGETAIFSVTVTDGNPTTTRYQWQYSTDNGANWGNVSGGTGATGASYTTSATTSAMNGYKYRCAVENGVGGEATTHYFYSNAATLTVNYAPVILTQPVSAAVTSGQTANFTVAVTPGNPTTTRYQWQYSTDNGANWSNVSGGTGATTASYTTPTTTFAAMNGWKYRCAVENGIGGETTTHYVYSNGAATLTVRQIDLTDVNLSTTAPQLGGVISCTTVPAGATATATFSWEVSDDGSTGWGVAPGSGSATANYTVADADLGKFLRVVVTANGEYVGSVIKKADAKVNVKITKPGDHQTQSSQIVSATITAGSLAINTTDLDKVSLVGPGIDRDLATTEYTAVDGSIVITLNNAFLNTLAVGDYTLTAHLNNNRFNNITVSTTFRVTSIPRPAPASDGRSNPSTGLAHTELWVYAAAALPALTAAAAFAVKKNKNDNAE